MVQVAVAEMVAHQRRRGGKRRGRCGAVGSGIVERQIVVDGLLMVVGSLVHGKLAGIVGS